MAQELMVIAIVMMIPILALVFKHQQEMETIRASAAVPKDELQRLRSEYEDFVFGADTRIRKLEDRVKLLESRLRQTGTSADISTHNHE